MGRRPDVIVPTFVLALAIAGCSSASIDAVTTAAPRAPVGSVPGHVYLLRGLVGEVFSLGFYDLAARIKQRGVEASVHSMYAPGSLASEIIASYRRAPAPIVLIGHSSGADSAIDVAEYLRRANIPVALMFGFDPTPLAGRVPANVELFINLYQKTNLIGGGEALVRRLSAAALSMSICANGARSSISRSTNHPCCIRWSPTRSRSCFVRRRNPRLIPCPRVAAAASNGTSPRRLLSSCR